MSELSCVAIEPQAPANASVIWLHGLGASGHDFEPLVPELRLPPELAVRFVFPHAPAIPVTVNGGMVMPAWYDIRGLGTQQSPPTQQPADPTDTEEHEQLLRSAAAVEALIERERQRGVDPRRIVVAGFSQGGAVAYQVALSYPRRLAGLLALSSYFATRDSLQPHPANRDLPILICHGLQDPMLPEAMGRRSADDLRAMGYPVEYRTYAVDHAVCPEEIATISNWLQEVLAAPA